MFKKCITIIIIVSLIICAVCTVILNQKNQKSNQAGLIFTLFNPELQKASNYFYSEYLTSNPSVANYSGKIISLKKKEEGYYVKFGIYPYIAAHNPVGYDEVEYFVDNIGIITLLNFSHKKNYEIPERLKAIIKKPIPIS